MIDNSHITVDNLEQRLVIRDDRNPSFRIITYANKSGHLYVEVWDGSEELYRNFD